MRRLHTARSKVRVGGGGVALSLQGKHRRLRQKLTILTHLHPWVRLGAVRMSGSVRAVRRSSVTASFSTADSTFMVGRGLSPMVIAAAAT